MVRSICKINQTKKKENYTMVVFSTGCQAQKDFYAATNKKA